MLHLIITFQTLDRRKKIHFFNHNECLYHVKDLKNLNKMQIHNAHMLT